MDPGRPRRVVELAASMTKVHALRVWLLNDEHGKHEARAKQLLERAPQVKLVKTGRPLSEREVDAWAANEIVLVAAQAMLADAAGSSSVRRRSRRGSRCRDTPTPRQRQPRSR